MFTIRSLGRQFVVVGVVFSLAVIGLGQAEALAAPPNSQGHAYRHGVVPQRPGVGHHGANSAPAASTSNLNYGGGVQGVGVTTGAEKVYLVFWGSQWGAQSTNAQGYTTLSGDPNGAAPVVQGFMKGLGTGGELWSGVMTQYCEGIAAGSQTCPSTAAHVGYPTGGALAGVWVDESTASPASATGNQLGTEAVAAAGHFGNTTAASNRNTQYVILSPTGTTPDGFNTASGNFCAWHDYTGDSTLSGGAVSSPYGPIAFTNMPYVTDAGSGCGQNFVNSGSAGTDDGFTIVGGHEYAETVTDQFPAGGWTDSSGNENGDKCAWISSGQGASQNITLTTGTFAVQSTWSNDTANCQVSHAIVGGGGGGGGNTVTVTNPGNQTSTAGTAVSLQIQASDSASGQTLTYSASGLPAGLLINSSSGLISGTPTTAGSSSVTVTATDTTGASGSTSFSWTVNPSGGGGCSAAQLLGDPGFESGGSGSPWAATSGVFNNSSAEPAHSGSWDAWMDGYGTTHADTLSQSVTIPSGCSGSTLSFWLHIDTAETGSTAHDTLQVQLLNSSGTVLTTLASYSNLNAASGYAQKTFNVGGYAGQAVTLKLTATENSTLQTSFVVDDFALNTAAGSSGGGGNTVTVTNPGNQTGTVGTATSLQIQASDSGSGQTLTYSAAGLPAGLSINSSSGLISGTPTTAGTSSVTVTAKDGTGATGSTSFSWTINPSSSGCTAAQLLGNPGFETGSASPWTATSGVINNSSNEPAHSGSWDAWLDGYGTTHTDTLKQTVSIPANCATATLSFWLHVDTAETTTTTAYDTLKVQVLNSAGTVLSTLHTYSNLDHATGYQQHSFDLSPYIGQTITLRFTGSEDASLQTSFVLDDTAIQVK